MKRLLLIDDEPELRFALKRGLERAGWEVVEAEDGRSALRVLAEQEVDLVITDILMSDIEGIELILSLQRSHQGLPIIAMSGGGRLMPESYLKLARASGASKVLAKPFEISELTGAVRELLGEG